MLDLLGWSAATDGTTKESISRQRRRVRLVHPAERTGYAIALRERKSLVEPPVTTSARRRIWPCPHSSIPRYFAGAIPYPGPCLGSALSALLRSRPGHRHWTGSRGAADSAKTPGVAGVAGVAGWRCLPLARDYPNRCWLPREERYPRATGNADHCGLAQRRLSGTGALVFRARNTCFTLLGASENSNIMITRTRPIL